MPIREERRAVKRPSRGGAPQRIRQPQRNFAEELMRHTVPLLLQNFRIDTRLFAIGEYGCHRVNSWSFAIFLGQTPVRYKELRAVIPCGLLFQVIRPGKHCQGNTKGEQNNKLPILV